MAEKDEVKTYGVGPDNEKKNIGEDINQFSRIDDKGRVWEAGEVIYDPEDNPYEYRQDDGDFIARAEKREEDEAKLSERREAKAKKSAE
jgi:hypothetical protein